MGTSSKSQTATSSTRDVSRFRWFVGMCIASVFSLVYLVAPVYILTCIISLAFQYPTRNIAIGYSLPMIVSAIVPSISTPRLSWLLNPMLDYFDYNEEFELDNEAFRVEAAKGKRFIIAIQPHGVISFVGLCSWISTCPVASVRVVVHGSNRVPPVCTQSTVRPLTIHRPKSRLWHFRQTL